MRGRSMEPALKGGDLVTYSTNAYSKIADVKRWDIIVHILDFGKPTGTGIVAKRVVGLPGDKLEFKDNMIILNGSPIKLPPDIVLNYKNLTGYSFQYLNTNGNLVFVPADCVFTLGDNAVISLDSRHYGPVQFECILGKVVSTRPGVKIN